MTLLFVILLMVIFWNLLMLAIRATWGILKILLWLVFLPVTLVGLLIGGLMYIAWPLLLIAGIAALLAGPRG